MPHYHTGAFDNEWRLIRETATSQKYRVNAGGTEVEVDIHFTPEKVLTVNLVVQGSAGKSLLTPIMDEIARLGLNRGDYAVIDYTLAETASISEGNYSIDEKDREHRQL